MRIKLVGFLVALITLFTVWAVHPKQIVKAVEEGPSTKVAVVENNQTLPPNEMGRIMILEYHLIGYPEAQWRRTPENFRKDLQMLYDNGYYPVALEDLISGKLDVPYGKTPFVLTFDDSSQGQFRYLKEGQRLVVDPECAVGIMEEFKREHPDFPLTATFYVLPEIPKGLRLFGQEEYIRQKLNYLVQHGYEIGNHTYWHQNLGKTDDAGVQKQLALAIKDIQSYIPGYQVHSLALPLGVHPKNQSLERAGEYQGLKYHNDSILLVGSGTVPSPYSLDFNPYRLERIQAGDTIWGPKAYVDGFRKNPSLRYVSDGDPQRISIPKELENKLNRKFIAGNKVHLIKAPALVEPLKVNSIKPVKK
ncbi:MAG: polysaccharide deacetylase family protein [Bacillota bacterium]